MVVFRQTIKQEFTKGSAEIGIAIGQENSTEQAVFLHNFAHTFNSWGSDRRGVQLIDLINNMTIEARSFILEFSDYIKDKCNP